jgi:hypothetical protein
MDDETNIMIFGDNNFRDGLNLTIRRGTKWNGLRGKMPYGLIHKHGIFGCIEVLETKSIMFKDIQKEDLLLARHPGSRFYEGLLERMNMIYKNFGEHEIVTLIYFVID